MSKKNLIGITISVIGITMAIVSLSIFSSYFLLSPPGILKLDTLFFNLLKSRYLPLIILPISGILMLILGIFSILSGLLFSPPMTIIVFGILMLILGIFSILSGSGFFFYPRYQFHFFSIYPLFILISGVVYILSSFFLFKLKDWIRKIIINYSIITIIYFTFLLIWLTISGAWQNFFAGVLTFSLIPHILFPLFFIIFLTRPKVKEQFKK